MRERTGSAHIDNDDQTATEASFLPFNLINLKTADQLDNYRIITGDNLRKQSSWSGWEHVETD